MNPLKKFKDQARKSARKIIGVVERFKREGLSGRDIVGKLKSRLNLWQNVGKEIFGKGLIEEPQIPGIPEKRYRWQLGATEEHCADCSRLQGKVLTASEWKSIGIRPQSRDLECGGWNCDCVFIETDAESVGLDGI